MPPAVSPFQHIQQPQQQQQQPSQHPPLQMSLPALHLYPLNDSFVPKQISLHPQQGHVKIGRQTNAKTVPGERNGYFDSKVLSRQHAEIWEENAKIFIKDVKSSNGTFINGERLSAEGIESEPFELKTDDTVEFGIDIVGEDNKTIIHHKVAAKVVVVLTPEDLASLPLQRRPPPQQMPSQGLLGNGALGGMGGAPRQMKSGLTFDHILSRLQAELSKSRDTGNDLQQLAGVMTDVQETLGGAIPPNLPPYPQILPPVRPLPAQQQHVSPPPPAQPDLSNIHAQLSDTQSTLSQHLDAIRTLEQSHATDTSNLQREVASVREQMEERKREVEILLVQRQNQRMRRDLEDDDDSATEVPDQEDMDRPRTPEPTGNMSDEEYEEVQHRPRRQPKHSVPDLAARLEALAAQLDSAIVLSKTLQDQAAEAHATIATLEAKVGSLEAYVAEVRNASPPPPPLEKSVWEDWRERVEGGWRTERESWVDEQARLREAVQEWQKRTTELEQRTEEHHVAFASSSSEDEDDARVPGMAIVPQTPAKRGKHSHGRRRKRGEKDGLPSPMSSPTSSSSMYPSSSRSHTRRSTSPSSVEPSTSSNSSSVPDAANVLLNALNGKLPLSPPNTSPPESLAAVEDEAQVEEVKDAPLPEHQQVMAQQLTQGQVFKADVNDFAARNGLGPGGPGFKEIFGGHPFQYISAASVVLMGVAAWAAVNRDQP